MDIVIPVALVVLVTAAFFFSIKVRARHTKGGITERPAAPGVTSGSAQDSDGGEDRESFGSQVHGRGTH